MRCGSSVALEHKENTKYFHAFHENTACITVIHVERDSETQRDSEKHQYNSKKTPC